MPKRNIVLLTMLCFFLLSSYCLAEIPEESFSRNIDGIFYYGNDSAQTLYSRKEGTEGYLALVEEQSPNNWIVKTITDNNSITRENPNQEIIHFGKYLASVGLYYSCGTGDMCDIVGNGAYSGHFSCPDQSQQKQSIVYSPCSSRFSVRHSHFLGVTYTIDVSKLVDVVTRLNLVEKVREFKANKEKVQGACRTFKDRIKISPEIIDLTGTVKQPNILAMEINEDCDSSTLKDSTYHVALTAQDKHSIVEIIPSTYDLKYNAEGYLLHPKITVLKKTFFEVKPNKTFENKDIAITLKKVKMASPDSNDIVFTLDIANKSDNAISIDEISLHINNLDLTPVLSSISSRKLPPQSVKNGINFIIREKNGQSTKAIQSAVQAINVSGDKSLFSVLTIQLGIEVKYNSANSGQSLKSAAQFLYMDIAADSPPDAQIGLPVDQLKSESQQEKPQKRMRGSTPF